MNTAERLQRLFDAAEWSPDEKQWVLDYLETTDNQALRKLMEEKFIADKGARTDTEKAEQLLAAVRQKIAIAGKPAQTQFNSGGLLHYFKKRTRMTAAAVLLILAGAGYLYMFSGNSMQRATPVLAQARVTVDEVAPGTSKAKLTLADGSEITLDSASNGTLAHQGNTKVIKTGGQIAYAAIKENTGKPVYNTMSTARGNKYQLQLADGSRVWLNAASSIKFPASFSGAERRVAITGEVYFEVAHNAEKPFRVEINNAAGKEGEIEVLGTHFNVNAYDDESLVKTTLAEGKIKMVKDNSTEILHPSQQAVWSRGSSSIKVSEADTEKELAWTNGMFEFKNDDMQTIMRQLARWYDIDVQFSRQVSKKLFYGSVRRQSNLSQVLQILKAAGAGFEVNDRTVIVN